ncbi:hypothetical protein HHI36_018951 [Cryptolaemus montrouzieri]|uniref:Methyltransferase-like protein 22 n=1 Tax=Cryptolaemus montrouzieri TaxID=559131 RepID=A0ABD2P1I0_9CUCU
MDYKVTSEIYSEFEYASPSKPWVDEKYVVSSFKFKYPPQKPKLDEDGDLVVSRKSEKQKYGVIEIEHRKKTSLDLVGTQMWRGSLLLADWLLNNGDCLPKDSFILELGGGVGFTSIIASMFCPVICTDIKREDLLQLMESNVKRNAKFVKNPVTTCELDFFIQIIPKFIAENIDKISIIIAAEVIYNDQLTDAFIKTVEHLFMVASSEKILYLAVEKRFVFTIADCDSVAPCFEHFLRQLACSKLAYEELPISFPKCFEYDRVKQLVLCKLKLKD